MMRTLTLVAAAALIVPGCATRDEPVGRPIETVWERPPQAQPAPEPISAVSPAGSEPADTQPALDPVDVIAVVNGTPIRRSTLTQQLIESHGLSLLEQHILLIAARQRAAELGLQVRPADIAAAHEDALRRMTTPVGSLEEAPLDRPTAERLLNEFLIAKNVSRSEWDRRMEQQAYLRKIAEAEVAKLEITPEMLKEEHDRIYGERVQIRHIQLSSLEAVARARALLAGNKDFELVARQMSENQITAARGGLMPPFSRNDPAVTPLIREAAFSLDVGQVSTAISEGNWYHLIKVERKFPASGVGIENVDKAALEAKLRERLIRQRQDTLDAELFRSATVDVKDPQLSRQFRERHRSERR